MRRTTTALLAGLALLLAACNSGSDATSTPAPDATGASSEASASAAASTDASAEGGRAATSGAKSPVEAGRQIEAARRAAEVTFAQQTLHYDFALSITGIPDLPAALTISGEGASDFVSGRSRTRLDFASFIDALRYELTPEEAAEFDTYFGDGTFEVISDGTTTYMYMPFMGALLEVDTPWISMQAPAGAVPFEGLQGSGLPDAAAFGPDSLLALLELLDSFDAVGTEDVRGVPTTHWAGTLSFEKLFELMDPSMQSQFQWQYEQTGMFDLVLPLDVWVDADGLTRRFVMNLDLGVFDPSAAGASFEFRYDFFDFGVPVDVTLPAAGDVTDVTELMSTGFGF